MPAWKAALWTFVIGFFALLVFAGLYAAVTGHDPEGAGRAVGKVASPIVLFAPILAYFVQKDRLEKKG